MGIEDPNELTRIDAEIARARRQYDPRPWDEVEEADAEFDFEFAGDDEAALGAGAEFEPAEPLGEEIDAEMWGEELAAWHNAPMASHFEILQRQGVELPAPEMLDDQALHETLWHVIHRLAERNTFLSQTDHLSDRELYEHLWYDSLREGIKDLAAVLPPEKLTGPDAWIHSIDILGTGSEADLLLHLQYYADDDERAWWAQQYPDLEQPAHVDPPYDRDRHLPQPPDAFIAQDEPDPGEEGEDDIPW
jgi:hypothetical protein